MADESKQMTRPTFAPDNRVTTKQKPLREGRLVRRTLHTNGSPRWHVQFDDDPRAIYLVWEVDLRHVRRKVAEPVE